MINASAIKLLATRSFSRGLLITKQYSPEILTTVGIVGVVTASVLGAKATLKIEPVVDQVNTDIAKAKKLVLDEDLSQHDFTKYATATYTRGALDLTKIYGPALSLGLGSIACILAAHGIMKRRNVALVAAYNVLEKGFGEYRKRVIEELGEEKDRDFRLGIRETIEKDEKGKDIVVAHIDPNGLSPYAKFFDEFSTQYSNNAERNLLVIKHAQQFANDLLYANGHVFLNEVYDSLGIERTEAGAVVGWILGEEHGDDFVDFGMYDASSVAGRRFIAGQENAILLDFNVNGLISSKIGKKF